jgi:transposase
VENSTTIAVDLARAFFQVSVSTVPGRVKERRRLTRAKFVSFLAQHPPAEIVMEACGSAHYWARTARDLGHQPVLLPAHYTKKYVLRDKHDRADADAILEARRREAIQPVPIKTVEQQSIAFIHRMRSGWIQTRTARINAMRAILRELGTVIPTGPRNVVPRLPELLADVPEALHPCLLEIADEIRRLEANVKVAERQLKALLKDSDASRSLQSIPGIGLITCSAMIAFVGSPNRFRSCRAYASYFGITPKEHSSGAKRRLGSINKEGDTYLRTLLIHGARAVLLAARRSKNPDRLQAWALRVQDRRGHNRAAVALANKIARIAWAVWSKGTLYQSLPARTRATATN